MSDNPNPITLRLALDRVAIAESQAGINSLVKDIQSAKSKLQETGAIADKSVRSLKDVFASTSGGAKDAVTQVEGLRKSLGGVRDEVEKTQKAAKGGFGVEGLRRTGGALSQLGLAEAGGAVQRLGDVGQIGKEFGQITEALGPLSILLPIAAGGIIGFQLGLKVLDAELTDGKKALDAASAQVTAYYAALAKGTTDALQKQLADLEEQKKLDDAELGQRKEAKDKAFKSEQNQFGGDARARVLTGLGDLEGAFKSNDDRIKELEGSTVSAAGKIEALKDALKSTEVAVNDAELAFKAEQAVQLQAAKDNAAIDRQIVTDSKLTSDQMKQRVKDLQQETGILEAQAASIESLSKTDADAKKEFDALQKQIAITKGEVYNLTQNLIPAKKNLEAFNDAIAKIAKGASDFIKGGIATAERLAGEIADRDQRVVDVQKKYEDDVKAAEQKGLEERAAIQKKYNDKLVEIARNAADEAAASLEKLQQAQADNATSLGRDEAKSVREANDQLLNDRIKAQQDEARATRQHYQELDQIRKDAYAREFDFLSTRNFLGLYSSRLQTTRDIERSNTSFGNSQNESRISQEQTQQDQARAFDAQRRERLIAYQQQNADAKLAYNRELADQQRKEVEARALALKSANDDKRDLAKKLSDETRLRNAAYTNDLILTGKYGAAYVAAHDKINNAILDRANALLTRMGQAPVYQSSSSTSKTANVSVTNNINGAGNSQQTGQDIAQQVISIAQRIFK